MGLNMGMYLIDEGIEIRNRTTTKIIKQKYEKPKKQVIQNEIEERIPIFLGTDEDGIEETRLISKSILETEPTMKPILLMKQTIEYMKGKPDPTITNGMSLEALNMVRDGEEKHKGYTKKCYRKRIEIMKNDPILLTKFRKQNKLYKFRKKNKQLTPKELEKLEIRNYFHNIINVKRTKEMYKTDPTFRLIMCIRSRLYSALKARSASKDKRTFEYIGCTISELKNELTKQLKEGMTWDNYGKVWHVDHRIPLSWFELNIEDQKNLAFHHTNLKPMFAEDNLKKSASFSEPSLIQIFNQINNGQSCRISSD